jgi:hypothetical protein
MEDSIIVRTSEKIDFESRKNRHQNKFRTAEDRKKSYEASVVRLKKAVEKDGGRYIEFVDSDGSLSKGILLAGVKDATDEKKRLYFAYLDKNRIIRRSYHGDTYRLLREIPVEFGIIDYLYRHEFKDFKQMVEDSIQETGWEVLTKIMLREPKHKPIPNNRRGKFRKNNKKK